MARPGAAPPADARPGASSPAVVASLLLLAAWLGAALLATAAVAPAAFAVLPTRALAGALVGRVLPAVFVSGAVTGTLVAVVAWARRPGRRGGRTVASAALMLVVGCLVAQLGITPRIERLRSEVGVPIDELARSDPRRASFGRLHGGSVVALGVSMLAGAVALVIGARAIVPPSSRPRDALDA